MKDPVIVTIIIGMHAVSLGAKRRNASFLLARSCCFKVPTKREPPHKRQVKIPFVHSQLRHRSTCKPFRIPSLLMQRVLAGSRPLADLVIGD